MSGRRETPASAGGPREEQAGAVIPTIGATAAEKLEGPRLQGGY